MPASLAQLGTDRVQERKPEEIPVHQKLRMAGNKRLESDDIHMEPRPEQPLHSALDTVVPKPFQREVLICEVDNARLQGGVGIVRQHGEGMWIGYYQRRTA